MKTSGATHFVCQVFFLTPAIAVRMRESPDDSDSAMPCIVLRGSASVTVRQFIYQSLGKLCDEVRSMSNESIPDSAANRRDPARGLVTFDPPSVYIEDYELYLGFPDGTGIMDGIQGEINGFSLKMPSKLSETPTLKLSQPHYSAPSQVVLQHPKLSFPYTFVVASAGLNLATITAAAPKGLKARLIEDARSGELNLSLTVPGRTKMEALVELKRSLASRVSRFSSLANGSKIGTEATTKGDSPEARRQSATTSLHTRAVSPTASSSQHHRQPTVEELAEGYQPTVEELADCDADILDELDLCAYDVAQYSEGPEARWAAEHCRAYGPLLDSLEVLRRRTEAITQREKEAQQSHLRRVEECHSVLEALIEEKAAHHTEEERRRAITSLELTRKNENSLIGSLSRALEQRRETERAREEERNRLLAAGKPTLEGRSDLSTDVTTHRKHRESVLYSSGRETAHIARSKLQPLSGPLSAALHSDWTIVKQQDDVSIRRANALARLTKELDDGCEKAKDEAVQQAAAARATRRDQDAAQDQRDFVRVAEKRELMHKRQARAARNEEVAKLQRLKLERRASSLPHL